jgi:hypothetical protein
LAFVSRQGIVKKAVGLEGRHMLVSLALIIEASHWNFALVSGSLS